MVTIHTPLLVVGGGPAAVVAAKVASGWGLPCLLVGPVGEQPPDDPGPTVLDQRSRSILERHGVLGVLRPHATAQDPFTITPLVFERALRHHCVADTLITVYDGMSVSDVRPEGRGVAAVLRDGRRAWDVHADAHLDVSALPSELNGAIRQAAEYSDRLITGDAADGAPSDPGRWSAGADPGPA
jgi:hypothetical protein